MGSATFGHGCNGAIWRFASAGTRDRFPANAEMFAPHFGGYCAWAVSQNYIAPSDPIMWRIVDGRASQQAGLDPVLRTRQWI